MDKQGFIKIKNLYIYFPFCTTVISIYCIHPAQSFLWGSCSCYLVSYCLQSKNRKKDLIAYIQVE